MKALLTRSLWYNHVQLAIVRMEYTMLVAVIYLAFFSVIDVK